MTVSIIVPTYNHEKYIARSLDSIFMQETDCDCEILVGDDASTDSTPDILKQYVEKYPGRIKLFLREQNLGGTRNSYELLMAATGKYIATLEGDDYWTDSKKLQKQIDFLEDNPGFIGTCHKFDVVDSDGNFIKKKINWVKHKKVFTLADFQGVYLPSQPSTFVRRNIYLDKSKDYSFLYKINKMISDRTAVLLYLSRGDFYCFDDVMSVYRVATGSGSSITKTLYNNNKNAIEMDLELTEKLERLAEEYLEVSADFTGQRKILYLSAVIRFIKSRDSNDLAVLKRIRGKRKRIGFLAYVFVGMCKIVAGKLGKK